MLKIIKTLVLLSVFSCATKTPPPVTTTQKRLPELALWNTDVKKEDLDRALNNFFLKDDRRDFLGVYPEMLPNTRVTLRRTTEPNYFYPDKKFSAYVDRCKNMISTSCFKVGKTLMEKRKFYDARKYLVRGCNLNEGESCYLAGVLDFNEQKYKSAKSFYEKGCVLESMNACYHLNEHFFDEEDDEDIIQQKLSLYDLQCRRGHHISCVRWAHMSIGDDDSSSSKNKENLQKGCKTGEPLSCYYLARYFDLGSDKKQAQSYVRLSCEYGSPEGCFELVKNGYGLSNHRKIILKKALELGFNQWEALELNTGLDWIRNDKNVREMIDVYVLKGAR
tara:strand:- start:135 stop:1136 length:1002 start_codon:yes stop_codon:yes gene_type:complete